MAHVKRGVKGNRFAKCAVETALLDALGKRLGLPVSELLGGRQHETSPVAWTLASGDTKRDIEEAERMLDVRRHNIFKLKIGLRAVDDDVAHVAAIKKALGSRAARPGGCQSGLERARGTARHCRARSRGCRSHRTAVVARPSWRTGALEWAF